MVTFDWEFTMKLLIITLLVCVCVPCLAQTASVTCSPRVNPDTCRIASNQLVQFTAFVRLHSELRRITILDSESYKKEKVQHLTASATDSYHQVFSGPFFGNILFETEGTGICPVSAVISSDIIDANSEMVLDEKGQVKLDSNGHVTMRELPPTALTKTITATTVTAFLDGYTQGCSGGVQKFSTELQLESERNKRK